MTERNHESREVANSRQRIRRPLAPEEGSARFADTYLEIARLFLAYGKTDMARRRLLRLVSQFADAPAVLESRKLLESLEFRVDSYPATKSGHDPVTTPAPTDRAPVPNRRQNHSSITLSENRIR